MGWGDEVMVTGQVRELQRVDPRRVRIIYERDRWHEAWNGNPRIARPGEAGDFQVLYARINGLRPYMQQKRAQQWIWQPWGPPRGELYLTESERGYGARFAGRVVIECGLKAGASPNKQWPVRRWQKLANHLRASGLRVAQLGPSDANVLQGVEWIRTQNMREAAAVLRHSLAAVVPEGGLHHVAAAVGCPAVVIFGGYIAPAVTGYAFQKNIFTGSAEFPLGCGRRSSCEHCRLAMEAVSTSVVIEQLGELLATDRRRLPA